MRSKLCRCDDPDRQRDGDGVNFCGTCGELLHSGSDELLAAVVKKLDRLGKEVEHLAGHGVSGDG